MSAAPGFYVVSGVAKRGTVTYRCPTAEWALRKLRDFRSVHYRDVAVTGPDGETLSAEELEARAVGAPAEGLTVLER